MRVLFLSAWYPTRLDPANGIFVQRHAEAVALHHQVEVLHALADPSLKTDFEVVDEVINGIRTVIVYHRKKAFSPKNFLMRMQAYREGYRRLTRPDIVHANVMDTPMLFACWLKWEFRIPFVLTEHWSAFLNINRNKLTPFRKGVAQFISRQAAAVLPVSRALSEDLKSLSIRNVRHTIGNVVDTRLFSPKPKPASPHFTFLHLSSLLPLKNPETIIRAVARLHQELPHVRLVIGGEGDIRPFQELVRSLRAGDFITVVGWQSPEQVAAWMQVCDAFILFSDYENFPCVLLESLSTGTPLIGPRVGGIPEIIRPENGLLIEKTEGALLGAMRQMAAGHFIFSSEKLRQPVVKNFSREVIAQKFSAEYARALNKNGA